MKQTELDKFIFDNKSDAEFTGGVKNDQINYIENELNIMLPESYKCFLSKYGHGGLYGETLLGCGLNETYPVIDQTIRYRKLGIGNKFVVIQNLDEFVYCLDTTKINDGECSVKRWDRVIGFSDVISCSFSQYALRVFQEAKEDWDDEI